MDERGNQGGKPPEQEIGHYRVLAELARGGQSLRESLSAGEPLELDSSVR